MAFKKRWQVIYEWSDGMERRSVPFYKSEAIDYLSIFADAIAIEKTSGLFQRRIDRVHVQSNDPLIRITARYYF